MPVKNENQVFNQYPKTIMIPQIIHYTWFSNDPMPAEIIDCINSWKKHMPHYTFKKWDMEAIKDIQSIYLQEAIMTKKWAYAADYIRLYAIYNEGGIYLDTDAKLLQPLDIFLQNEVFIGKENSIHVEGNIPAQYLTSHCFGAIKGHPYIKDCLEYYNNRHFIMSNNEKLPIPLKYNFVLLPYIQAEIARLYGYNWKPLTQNIQYCNNGLVIYPTEYFDAINDCNRSFCRHLALGSWRVDKQKEPIYNIQYKIKWRIIYLFQWILKKFNYITFKIE